MDCNHTYKLADFICSVDLSSAQAFRLDDIKHSWSKYSCPQKLGVWFGVFFGGLLQVQQYFVVEVLMFGYFCVLVVFFNFYNVTDPPNSLKSKTRIIYHTNTTLV